MIKWVNDVGPGWRPFVAAAIPLIEAKGGFIMQVKEKFGGLRLYTHGGDYDAIEDIVRTAEGQCSVTCEECGEPGNLVNLNGILKTCCAKHAVRQNEAT